MIWNIFGNVQVCGKNVITDSIGIVYILCRHDHRLQTHIHAYKYWIQMDSIITVTSFVCNYTNSCIHLWRSTTKTVPHFCSRLMISVFVERIWFPFSIDSMIIIVRWILIKKGITSVCMKSLKRIDTAVEFTTDLAIHNIYAFIPKWAWQILFWNKLCISFANGILVLATTKIVWLNTFQFKLLEKRKEYDLIWSIGCKQKYLARQKAYT